MGDRLFGTTKLLKMKKCILIVIDSLGVGAAPDAKKYGDEESNTFGNVSKVNGELIYQHLINLVLENYND